VIREAASRQNFKAGDTSKGEMTLTGTPISVQKQQTFAALSFVDKDATPPLPKGVPTLERKGTSKAETKSEDTANGKTEQRAGGKSKSETRYLVLVALKQWTKIEEALKQNKNDKLVIKCMTSCPLLSQFTHVSPTGCSPGTMAALLTERRRSAML
jgi:hypothetical protein